MGSVPPLNLIPVPPFLYIDHHRLWRSLIACTWEGGRWGDLRLSVEVVWCLIKGKRKSRAREGRRSIIGFRLMVCKWVLGDDMYNTLRNIELELGRHMLGCLDVHTRYLVGIFLSAFLGSSCKCVSFRAWPLQGSQSTTFGVIDVDRLILAGMGVVAFWKPGGRVVSGPDVEHQKLEKGGRFELSSVEMDEVELLMVELLLEMQVDIRNAVHNRRRGFSRVELPCIFLPPVQ